MALTSSKSLGFGLIIASLLPLSHGAQQFSAQNKFMQESTARLATVVGLDAADPAPGKKASVELYSVVEFTDDEGARRTARTNISSYPAPHTIGEEINIRFHHTKKDDVRVASFTGLWFQTAFFVIPGLITLLGGVALIRSGRKPQS
ncbi:MAG: hypothetical protein AB8B79_22490 [Granulosicoccus sp.]